ncbi:MAG: hypothetical protein ACQEP1_06360 [Nanobdellota archaeon]
MAGKSSKVKEEEQILQDIERKKRIASKIKLKRQVKHFKFSDFAQAVIGVGVFGLPALINTSFWNYIPKVNLEFLFYIHLFFVFCAVIGKNYQFRSDLPLDDKWFMTLFGKHVVYMYTSVLIVIFFMLVLLNRVSLDMTMYDFLKNFLAAQSVGVIGAVTFTFFKKDD